MSSSRNRILAAILALAGLGVAVAASWAVVDTVIHATGDYDFCTRCHSHAPIGSSYRESLHGGNNASGWRASCSDCHIPHDNALHYLWVKGIHGVVDPTMEVLKDPLDIDWHANRARRQEYVYDSGCMGCHVYLQEQSQGNPRAFLPHRRYFSSEELTCVECHEQVGHARLGYHLEAMGWKKKREGDSP